MAEQTEYKCRSCKDKFLSMVGPSEGACPKCGAKTLYRREGALGEIGIWKKV